MSLAAGTKLGPYEILSPIGAGGMGEVYKARDTRLGRDVAIKVLPSHLSENPELKQRFDREAKAISQLTHPHICTLYDVGSQDGVEYLVMELLEGETLADRLGKGALPRDQVLRCGIEITEALEKAHRAGIIHRDLKPGNIMLTKSGVKLLDFGLAKMATAPLLPAEASSLPTQGAPNQPLTERGTVMGTFQYMAPEQLEGAEADARTDIFALGTVLYEMATGRKAFTGKSRVSLIGSILKDEPPLISSIQPMTPPALDHLVQTCLAKEPDDRFQTAHDVKLQLKWIAEGGSQTGGPGVVVSRRKSRERVAWGISAALFGVTALLGFGYIRRSPASPHPTRLRIELSEDQPLATSSGAAAVLSPDGRRIAYVAGKPTETKLYVRALDQWQGIPLAGTEGASLPFFSPDGDWIGFFAQGKLKKISITGGAPQSLADAPSGRGAAWGPDGTIIFSPDLTSGLWRVSETGGNSAEVVVRREKERSLRWPSLLPDGKAVLFVAQKLLQNYDDADVELFDFTTGKRTVVLQGGTYPSCVPNGHLTFVRGGTLFAAPFDPKRHKVTGMAVPLIEGVRFGGRMASGDGGAQYSVSRNGTLAYVPGVLGNEKYTIARGDRSGKLVSLPAQPQAYFSPRLSPDGSRLAVVVDEDIWVYEIARDSFSRLTFDKANSVEPAWSPDGRSIAYVSSREGNQANLYLQSADGSAEPHRLTQDDRIKILGAISPDAKVLAYAALMDYGKMNWDLFTLRLDGKSKPEPFLEGPAIEAHPDFSPDGRWIAYHSNESGKFEVYVRPFPGPGGKWQISTEGGGWPRWVDGGREIVYCEGDKLYSAAIETGENSLRAARPQEIFHGPIAALGRFSAFDVSRDGKSFVLLQPQPGAKPEAVTHVNLVFDWSAEVERVGSGKR